jgi:hypothetical protein
MFQRIGAIEPKIIGARAIFLLTLAPFSAKLVSGWKF